MQCPLQNVLSEQMEGDGGWTDGQRWTSLEAPPVTQAINQGVFPLLPVEGALSSWGVCFQVGDQNQSYPPAITLGSLLPSFKCICNKIKRAMEYFILYHQG